MGIVPPATSLATNPAPPPLIPLNQISLTTNPMVSCSVSPPTQTLPQQVTVSTGMFMGNAMLPLPEHLRKRILNLEYIEMADLHPEAWLFEEKSTNKTLATVQRGSGYKHSAVGLVLHTTSGSFSSGAPPSISWHTWQLSSEPTITLKASGR